MPTQSAPSQPAFKVTYPFDGTNGTQADMILRSADGVDFRVMKGVLAVASPIFHDMTALAKPLAMEGKRASSEVSEEGLPIVVMYESDAVVLDALLRILYPVIPPKLDDLELVSSLVGAAQKYDMASVLHVVEDALRNALSENSGERAMQVYLIACENRLEEIIRPAADAFLKCPLRPAYFRGLEKASASTLFHLFDYQRRVADAVDVLFAPASGHNWRQLEPLRQNVACFRKNIKPSEGCADNEYGYNVSLWWAALCNSARGEIRRAPLSDETVTAGRIASVVGSSRCCPDCKTAAYNKLQILEASIKQTVRNLASEVQFEYP